MANQNSVGIARDSSHFNDDLAYALSSVPWDFSGPKKADPTEKLHPYPAKFIPDIPAALLNALPLSDDSLIFDPFCGSGTTLATAQSMGFESFGVDLNPIACLIARVRTAPLTFEATACAEEVVAKAKCIGYAPIPAIPNLDHWFAEPAQNAVARLVQSIKFLPAESWDFLRLALSSVLVRVSNQDSDTRYAAVKKNITEDLVYSAFISSAARIEKALINRNTEISARVFEHDTLSLTPEHFPRKVSAAITSPPYPNAYEYWLYHKYRMWWLGHDPIAVKEREIGARAHFFGGKRHDETSFVFQMKQLFDLLDEVLDDDGYACFVIGRSKIHGKIVDNAAIIRAAGKAIGMRERFITDRVISSTRKSFNLSHANIKTETVVVLSR